MIEDYWIEGVETLEDVIEKLPESWSSRGLPETIDRQESFLLAESIRHFAETISSLKKATPFLDCRCSRRTLVKPPT